MLARAHCNVPRSYSTIWACCTEEQVEEIERQIQECIHAGLVVCNKEGDYRHHCSPCFLVAEPGWTAVQLVVDYGKVIEVEAPGLSGLWNVRVPNTQMLLKKAHDVMSGVRAFWRELYDKSLVQLGPATHWVWTQRVWAWGPVTTPTTRALGFPLGLATCRPLWTTTGAKTPLIFSYVWDVSVRRSSKSLRQSMKNTK